MRIFYWCALLLILQSACTPSTEPTMLSNLPSDIGVRYIEDDVDRTPATIAYGDLHQALRKERPEGKWDVSMFRTRKSWETLLTEYEKTLVAQGLVRSNISVQASGYRRSAWLGPTLGLALAYVESIENKPAVLIVLTQKPVR
jgi:hypothetical protein